MKKIIVKSILILSIIMMVSCKSTNIDKEVKEAQSSKSYVGWVDSTGKDVVYTDGAVNLRIKQSLGTFNLGIVNDRKKVIPALSTTEEFTTSIINLKTARKTYTLRKDANIQFYATRKDNGVEISYVNEGVFSVDVYFETFSSENPKNSVDFDSDMIKVTYTVTNLGSKKDDFALKAIFDTVLGEADKYHFYTSENLSIKNEAIYRTMKNQKWFVSKNKNAAMEFIFDGADTTAPEAVALANYSTLQNNSWEPEMTANRSFDTVLSYNNSAVGVIWPSKKLNPAESYERIFYISVAADGNEPAGHKYIFKQETEDVKKVEVSSEKAGAVTDISANEPVQEEKVETPAPLPQTPVQNETKEVEPKKNQVDPAYIQELIDRITELEKDTSKVSSDELDSLNKELDEILSTLR